MRKAQEIRITKAAGGYRVIYVYGLLDTSEHPRLFRTVKDARESIYNFCGNAKPAIPVILG